MMLRRAAVLAGLLTGLLLARAEDPKAAPPKGERVFSAGHSFHMFMPALLKELALSAGVKDHLLVGTQSIGGSRTIQHWDVADEKNKVKQALRDKKVDVLTLSPIFQPDEGVDNFVKLALEHNPDIRVLVQASWLPYDVFDPDYKKKRPEKVDRNARTPDEMLKIHAPYFKSGEDQVNALNKAHGKQVAFVAPIGHAVITLRSKIAEGKAPGLKEQEELFTDPIGHVKAPVQALSAYCYYAVIYKRSPVGLPPLSILKNAKKDEWDGKLNALLQEIAWETVSNHPLSGVKEARR